MKRLARFLIRLYPANWRERYGEEFAALLEDSATGWGGIFDLIKGAIKMQLSVPAFPKLALWLSLGGLAAGLGISYLVPKVFVSTAVGQIETSEKDSTNRNLVEHLMRLENEILSRTSLSRVIQDPRLDLYKSARSDTPLEDVIENMRRDIRIRVLSNAGPGARILAFSISFSYGDRRKAQETVQALLTSFEDGNLTSQRAQNPVIQRRLPDQVDRLEARIAFLEKKLGIRTTPLQEANQALPLDTEVEMDVIDPPSLPGKPVSPARSAFMAAGFVAGFVLALIIAIFRRRFDPPIPFPAQSA